jgi:penicillin-binding protein 1A
MNAFTSHSGIDARGTLRAAVYLGEKGGASTITQQLAKQLFTEDVSRSFTGRVLQKFKEWIIAVRLERQYTKEEIITMYFNKHDFVYQAVGIRSAARIYFDKEAKILI